mmetsp:Transcript_5708/g.8092  ORF Transcript_5708/g.8092 Transcript_5708/m.8092 type:complete len:155 (-) Transcript_5708:280-744(-)
MNLSKTFIILILTALSDIPHSQGRSISENDNNAQESSGYYKKTSFTNTVNKEVLSRGKVSTNDDVPLGIRKNPSIGNRRKKHVSLPHELLVHPDEGSMVVNPKLCKIQYKTTRQWERSINTPEVQRSERKTKITLQLLVIPPRCRRFLPIWVWW